MPIEVVLAPSPINFLEIHPVSISMRRGGLSSNGAQDHEGIPLRGLMRLTHRDAQLAGNLHPMHHDGKPYS